MGQISYPSMNGASKDNYFLPKSHKLAFLWKTGLQKQLWQPNLQTLFNGFLVLVRWIIRSFIKHFWYLNRHKVAFLLIFFLICKTSLKRDSNRGLWASIYLNLTHALNRSATRAGLLLLILAFKMPKKRHYKNKRHLKCHKRKLSLWNGPQNLARFQVTLYLRYKAIQMVRLLRSGIFSDDQVDRTVNSVIQWQRQNSGKFLNFFKIFKTSLFRSKTKSGLWQ